MNTDVFPDTASAIREFQRLVDFRVDRQHISTLSEYIEAHGRSRTFVEDLAVEVLTTLDQMVRGAGV